MVVNLTGDHVVMIVLIIGIFTFFCVLVSRGGGSEPPKRTPPEPLTYTYVKYEIPEDTIKVPRKTFQQMQDTSVDPAPALKAMVEDRNRRGDSKDENEESSGRG